MTSHSHYSTVDAESSSAVRLTRTGGQTTGGQTSDGAIPFQEIKSARRKRNKKPRTAFFGLGRGWAGRLTLAALLALIITSIGIPALVVKDKLEQDKLSFSLGSPHPENPEAAKVTAEVKPEPKEGTVPVTPDVHSSFKALKYTGDHGIMLLTAEEEWAQLRERFLAAVDNPNLLEGKIETGAEKQIALRMNMAMDLACLENAVVEAQSAIDSMLGVEDAPVMERYQKKIDARRRQAEAAALWEVAVKQDLLGSDVALKNAMLRFLEAVRSRAAASEYFTLALMHLQQPEEQEEATRRQYGEANSAYEAVASLAVAGQIAATNPLLVADVANWLSILFISI